MSGNVALRAQIKKLGMELPKVMEGFRHLHKEAVGEGVLSTKDKELMSVALAVALRCEYCIRFHTPAAVKAGASRAEILEAAGVAIFMAGGPAVTYAAVVLLDELDKLGVK